MLLPTLKNRVLKPLRKAAWDRKLARFPATPDGKRLLHVGCGEIDSPEFINLDARQLPHVHIVSRNIFRLRMIPDAALDMVYMSHVLEHVPRGQVLQTIKEMARVLKPDGILRISVPDFDFIVLLYEAAGRNIGAIAPALMGEQNHAFNFHYGVFNRDYLTGLLEKAGFREVRVWDPAHCEYHSFEDWASRPVYLGDRSFPISLNLEGRKS